MNKLPVILLIILPMISSAQKPNKQPAFCGWKYSDTAVIRSLFQQQLDFLRIASNDTIVDIGASSGSYEGGLSVIGDFKKVNFILVDIDSNCLNQTKVNNMMAYYSNIKGAPIDQRFSIVQNTTDSLNLPANSYKKAWLMNTLHEIPDKRKMVQGIYNILQKGGELVLLELLSLPKHTIHGGCHKPLMDEQEIKTLFEQNGFSQTDVAFNPTNAKKGNNPMYIVRFIKN